MKATQEVIDFDAAADTIILLSVDGREVAVPRRLVVAVPGSKHRYLRPESVLEEVAVCADPPAPHGWSRSDARRKA